MPTQNLTRQDVERLIADDTAKPTALRGAKLAGVDLSQLDLSKRDLSAADLSGANLSGTHLADAILARANLREAVLYGADLRGADLMGADAAAAIFANCDATRAGFVAMNLAGASFFEATLAGASFTQSNLNAADLRCANFRGARLHSCDLEAVDASSADFQKAELDESRVAGATFDGTDLREARLKGVSGFERASFLDADIRETDFRGSYSIRRRIIDENYLHEFRSRSAQAARLYKLWWITSDCGRSFWRWAAWTAFAVILFAVAYAFVDVDYGDYETPLSSLYFSVVTLTTLGYGDVLPRSMAAQVISMIEVIVGYVALGGLLSIFGNKMGRRGE